jgi:hypothetical protein
MTALSALCLTSGTAAGFGCSNCQTTGQDVLPYTEGIVNESGTIYQTSEVEGVMLHFPQGRTYALEHGLGVRPVTVDIYLSFRDRLSKNGDSTDKTRPNNVAPTAGNQAVIEVWNDEVIQIRNDTCAEFYLRLVAMADPDDVARAASLSGAAGAAGAPPVE